MQCMQRKWNDHYDSLWLEEDICKISDREDELYVKLVSNNELIVNEDQPIPLAMGSSLPEFDTGKISINKPK